jgi:hypothetical protein
MADYREDPEYMPDPPGNGWSRYQVYVLLELKRINRELVDVREALTKVSADVLTLKVKAATWGGLAGFALGLVPTLFKWLNVK